MKNLKNIFLVDKVAIHNKLINQTRLKDKTYQV